MGSRCRPVWMIGFSHWSALYPRLLVVVIWLLWMCGPAAAAGRPVLSAEALETRFTQLVISGKQADAEELLTSYIRDFVSNQRLVFLYGCGIRSRFEIQRAAPVFLAAARLGPTTPDGECAVRVLALDAHRDVEANFAALHLLADKNPGDVFIRWMLAVQCRNYNRNAEGVEQYRKILAVWKPGPCLVHQTYANLLDELGRYDEELVQRRIAVAQEPASWSRNGLISVLDRLKRYPEEEQVCADAVRSESGNAEQWALWGNALLQESRFSDAIEKCQKSLALDPHCDDAFINWGVALEKQGKYQEAIEVYRKAMQALPARTAFYTPRIANCERWMHQK